MLRVIIKSLKIVWIYEKLWLILNVMYAIVAGILPIFTIWISKELINHISIALQKSNIELEIIIKLLFMQFFISIFTVILSKFIEYLNARSVMNLDFNLNLTIFNKVDSSPYTFFELPDFQNDLKRLKYSLGDRFTSPIKSVFQVIKSIVSLVSLLILLANMHYWFVILCFLTAIPTFLVHAKLGKASYSLMYEQTPLTRDLEYTSRLLTEKGSVKEIRTFNLYKHLINRWKMIFLKQRNETLNLTKKESYYTTLLETFSGIITLISTIFLVILIKRNNLGIGEFVAVLQAFQTSVSSINNCSNHLARIYEDSIYLEDYFKFTEFKNQNAKIEMNKKDKIIYKNSIVEQGIVLENIHFSYPGTNKDILSDISLKIKAGEKVAIVGENGSGKSTLIKCILGLYSPSSGNIFVGGTNIHNLSKEDLAKKFTVIFQDFIKYSYTLKENIGFGNISFINNEESIRTAAKVSGLEEFINKLPNNYGTYLTRYLYDGIDLSGGQWQKIALSRAFIRDSEFVILDEPTAALDPISELEIFEKFVTLSNNKTVIFISHKMVSTRLADRIIVMHQGNIHEEGTFEELISNKGLFYEMYNIQNGIYKDYQYQ